MVLSASQTKSLLSQESAARTPFEGSVMPAWQLLYSPDFVGQILLAHCSLFSHHAVLLEVPALSLLLCLLDFAFRCYLSIFASFGAFESSCWVSPCEQFADPLSPHFGKHICSFCRDIRAEITAGEMQAACCFQSCFLLSILEAI